MDVCGLAFIVFERIAKLIRNIELLFTFAETIEHLLDLEEHVLALHFFPFERVFAFDDGLPKLGNHIDLLKETIHVAGASHVFEANIAAH